MKATEAVEQVLNDCWGGNFTTGHVALRAVETVEKQNEIFREALLRIADDSDLGEIFANFHQSLDLHKVRIELAREALEKIV